MRRPCVSVGGAVRPGGRLSPNLAVSINDISTGSWSPTGLASRTATTMAENTGTSVHNIVQGVSGIQTNRPCIVQLDVKSTNRFAYVQTDINHYANVNASTGAIGTVLGVTASAVLLSDGYVRLRIWNPAPATNNLGIYMSNGDNTIAYTGTSATMQVRNVLVRLGY